MLTRVSLPHPHPLTRSPSVQRTRPGCAILAKREMSKAAWASRAATMSQGAITSMPVTAPTPSKSLAEARYRAKALFREVRPVHWANAPRVRRVQVGPWDAAVTSSEAAGASRGAMERLLREAGQWAPGYSATPTDSTCGVAHAPTKSSALNGPHGGWQRPLATHHTGETGGIDLLTYAPICKAPVVVNREL
jgi:hypothetical protein